MTRKYKLSKAVKELLGIKPPRKRRKPKPRRRRK
tara:strand:- start:738 stop:839 length:102 start_codon:yes stop_codon:yes gene_type:complete